MVLRNGDDEFFVAAQRLAQAVGAAAPALPRPALSGPGLRLLEGLDKPVLVVEPARARVGEVAAQHQQPALRQRLAGFVERLRAAQGGRQQRLRHGKGGVAAVAGVRGEVEPKRRRVGAQVDRLQVGGEGLAAVQVAGELLGREQLARRLPQHLRREPGHRPALVGRNVEAEAHQRAPGYLDRRCASSTLATHSAMPASASGEGT